MIYCVDVTIKVEAENKIEADNFVTALLLENMIVFDYDIQDVYAEGDTGE